MAKNWDAWFRCIRGSLNRAALGPCTLVVWSASQPEEQDEKTETAPFENQFGDAFALQEYRGDDLCQLLSPRKAGWKIVRVALVFCYTLDSPVGKNWQLAIMSPTRNLKIVLLGVDQPTRRIARSLIGQQASWNLIGEFPAVLSAVESARFIRPDFIVVDQEAIEGEVASFIRRVVSAMPHARLLVLTWECSEQDIRASLRAGATGLLAKSEINNRFVSAIKRAASGERFLSGRLVRIVLRRFLDSAAVERTNGHAPFSDLTPREREIVRLIALGNGNKQVAAQLGIAVRTAEVHRANAMKKLNLHNLAELLHFAVSAGLIEVPAVGSNSH